VSGRNGSFASAVALRLFKGLVSAVGEWIVASCRGVSRFVSRVVERRGGRRVREIEGGPVTSHFPGIGRDRGSPAMNRRCGMFWGTFGGMDPRGDSRSLAWSFRVCPLRRSHRSAAGYRRCEEGGRPGTHVLVRAAAWLGVRFGPGGGADVRAVGYRAGVRSGPRACTIVGEPSAG